MTEFRREGCGGLILCGGRSSRMGFEKAALRFPGGTLLERVLGRMREVAAPVALSLAAEQELPPLPPSLSGGVSTVRDGVGGQGPLWGLLEGFRALEPHCSRVVVMPVDMPFFTPPWLAGLADGLEGHRACMYEQEGITNALTAAYDLALLPKLEGLVAEGRRRPIFLREGEPTRVIPVEEDGAEHPLMDVDTPEAYRAALLAEGIGTPGAAEVTVEFKLAPEKAPEGDAEPLRGFAALHAEKAGELLVCLLRLYPELGGASFGKGARLNLMRSLENGQAELLTSFAPLRRGEHLHLTRDA